MSAAALPSQPIPISIHAKFTPLLHEPHNIASIEGGRGGMKTEQVHLVALMRATKEDIRVFCCRETMSSIKDSSHKVLSDAIFAHRMNKAAGGPWEVQESRIIRRNGERIVAEFIFGGIRENVRDQKSLKGINLTIVEEASKVTEDSWTVLLPTVLRTPGAKAWAIWNPENVSDATYQLFKLRPPPDTIHIHTSYLDNPWLPDVLRVLAEHDKATDPAKYRHVWLGEAISEVSGGIFVEEMRAALDTGRICSVPYDRTKPVHTAWDLGFGDPTCIWFVQLYGGYLNFIDYLQDDGKLISDYAIKLQQRNYMYGTAWLPHDAVDNMIHRRMLGQGQAPDHSVTVQTLLRNAGYQVNVAAKNSKADVLNIARTKFPICRFDEQKCAQGIEGLRNYQWDREPDQAGKRKPLHNFASHPADAFMTACLSIKEKVPGAVTARPERASYGGTTWN